MGEIVLNQSFEACQECVLGHPLANKFADSQDSFRFYYRKIDPRKENFVLEATLIVEDAFGADFQTGFGIMAVDTIASPSPASYHRNHALIGRFRTQEGKNHGCGLRIVSGYSDPEAKSQGDRRILDPSRLFQTQPSSDEILEGERWHFILAKTDEGLEASMVTGEGTETVSIRGCDFLLRQDREYIYVGFALAGDIKLRVSDIRFVLTPGRKSHTPKTAIKQHVPDYPFDRSLFKVSDDVKRKVGNTRLFVSPGGESLDLSEALAIAAPGCEILLADGVYSSGPYFIQENTSGKRHNTITIRALNPGRAIIDGSGLRNKIPAMTLRGHFWIIDGLVFRNSPSCGLFVCGSDNVVKNCEASGNGDSGFLVCSFPGAGKREWPSRNRFESCLSHDNCDKVKRNADGFGCKLSVGKGNVFYSCRAVHNIDDGFDLYTKSILGPISPVTLIKCESAFNGWLTEVSRPVEPKRSGSGFKLGGESMQVRHVLKECYAHDNAKAGFDANSNHAAFLLDCESGDNNLERLSGRKIFILISRMFGGGAERVAVRLANELSANNDVSLLLFDKQSGYPLSERVRIVDMGLSNVRLPGLLKFLTSWYVMLIGIRFVSKIRQKERPDVTLSFLSSSNALNVLSKGSGKLVVSERNNPKGKGRLYFMKSIFSYSLADMVVFQSETVRRMFPKYIRNKGVVIPNPVVVESVANSSGRDKKIVTVGRIEIQKNQSMLVGAFGRFVKDHPDYSLHIYGQGEFRERLIEQIKSLGLEKSVFLHGYSHDVLDQISDAEFFVLSSNFEGMPNALIEAMMMGLPCVTTSFPGVEEFIGEDGACLTVPVGDEMALAGAMSELADNKELRKEIASKGAARSRIFASGNILPMWERALI